MLAFALYHFSTGCCSGRVRELLHCLEAASNMEGDVTAGCSACAHGEIESEGYGSLLGLQGGVQVKPKPLYENWQ
jgi:hypothetical protein